MPNPFYSAMGGNKPNMMQMLSQFKANPAQYLMRAKLNVPQNIMNDPQSILNYLVQSGQVSQEAYNKAYNMAKQFGGR